jgi:hypothetical protein
MGSASHIRPHVLAGQTPPATLQALELAAIVTGRSAGTQIDIWRFHESAVTIPKNRQMSIGKADQSD